MQSIIFILLAMVATGSYAQPVPVGTVLPARQTPVHDPVMIRQDSVYYLFCTGMGIGVWSSVNLAAWKREPPVFDKPPAWAVEAVPGYKGHTWAPDISYANGTYYLFYSVSAFGKNTSCIGVATNTTLHAGAPGYKWVDHGPVLQSVPGRDAWNAIDPNLVRDEHNEPWLVFGSFWSGLKMVKLKKELMAIEDQPQQWYSVASRQHTFPASDTAAGDGAIEAPFVFKKAGFYYLFASVDYCCRGEKSDYKMIVGRAATVTGPYVDKAGKGLLQGGGTLVLQGNKEWFGVGHNAVYTIDGVDYLVFHGYDAADKGRPKLRMEVLQWQDSWPVVGKR